MMILALLFFAGFASLIRYLFTLIALKLNIKTIWSTYTVNLFGSFFIGFIFKAFPDSLIFTYLAIGFCGALTTFSTLNYEMYTFFEEKKYIKLVGILILSYGTGLLACILGIYLSKFIS
ncbi:MAG: fluoride efflux transporter FluC [Lactovum sp.]